ncbi:AmmeMemoRadiSam system protein B [Rhodohalobacter halophilus]|uniref:AmmeMemoRadiSam system protein B n=1 Tax=Rhodohalobacter halophilus TaxID=1812810 RepID=UPI00083F5149|nr:AmmeMemoRadiSam system protein B [Rhodohalobacter halophilus]
MDITSLNRREITQGLEKAKAERAEESETVRILFSPQIINEKNIDEVFKIYSHIEKDDFDTVVIVESHPGSADKKLPMPSFKTVETSLGEVQANDKLRNDFCDEDDDFFINDDAFDEELSLYDQLMMLQCTLDDFTVLSIQITDENSFIIKELASALEEILASRNALIVFCCDMESGNRAELDNILNLYEQNNMSGLMNYVNSGESSIKGMGSFVTGLIVAKRWGLKLTFKSFESEKSGDGNLLTGFAQMQRQAIFK